MNSFLCQPALWTTLFLCIMNTRGESINALVKITAPRCFPVHSQTSLWLNCFFFPSSLQGLPGLYILISKLPHSQDRNPSITVNKYSRSKTEQVLTWPQTGYPWFTQLFEVTSNLYRCSIVACSGSQKPWAGLSLQHFPCHLGFRTASLFMLWPSANRTSRLLRLWGGSSSVREAPTQLSHGNSLLPQTPPQGDQTRWVGA